MEENLVFKGQWFLPSNVEHKVYGILTYCPHEAHSKLELFGSLHEFLSHEPEDLGITDESKEITICNSIHWKSTNLPRKNGTVLSRSHSQNFPQFVTFKVEYILEGVHIMSKDELVFQSITAEIFNLDEWIGVSGFDNINKTFSNGISFGVEYNLPKPISFKINDNLDGQFGFSVKGSNRPLFQREYKISQSTFVTITSKSYLTINEFLYLIYKFQNFLVLSIFTHTNPIHVELTSDKFGNDRNETIKILSSIRKKIKKEEPKTRFQMLFTYDEIENDFPNIID